jgi:hypothetical protein
VKKAKKQNVFLIMPEISKREKRLEWACRIALSVNVFVIVSSYVAYFQARYQLDSPLIPPSTVHEITDAYMKSSLVVSGLFLIGLWFYFLKKRVVAIIILVFAVLFFVYLRPFFRM